MSAEIVAIVKTMMANVACMYACMHSMYVCMYYPVSMSAEIVAMVKSKDDDGERRLHMCMWTASTHGAKG